MSMRDEKRPARERNEMNSNESCLLSFFFWRGSLSWFRVPFDLYTPSATHTHLSHTRNIQARAACISESFLDGSSCLVELGGLGSRGKGGTVEMVGVQPTRQKCSRRWAAQ